MLKWAIGNKQDAIGRVKKKKEVKDRAVWEYSSSAAIWDI